MNYVLLFLTSIASASCAARFATLPLAEFHSKAAAESGGVRIVSVSVESADAYCQCPELLPIRVTLHNVSPEAVALRYESFALRTSSGVQHRALPPFDLDTSDPAVPRPYAFPWSEFLLARHAGLYFRGFWHSADAMPPDTAYHTTYHDRLAAIARVSSTLLRRALPEGALAPGGYIVGVLYFEKPEEDRTAALIAHLTDDALQHDVATLDAPVVLVP